LLINRLENDKEGDKKNNREVGDDQNNTAINRGPEFNVIVQDYIACFIFVSEKHSFKLLEVLAGSFNIQQVLFVAKYKKNRFQTPAKKWF
jgi:hypothetical protein